MYVYILIFVYFIYKIPDMYVYVLIFVYLYLFVCLLSFAYVYFHLVWLHNVHLNTLESYVYVF